MLNWRFNIDIDTLCFFQISRLKTLLITNNSIDFIEWKVIYKEYKHVDDNYQRMELFYALNK